MSLASIPLKKKGGKFSTPFNYSTNQSALSCLETTALNGYLQNRKRKKMKVICVRLTLQQARVASRPIAQNIVCAWKFL